MPPAPPSSGPVSGDALLPTVAAATAAVVGEAFLHALVRTLGPALGASEVVVAEVDPPHELAAWRARSPADGAAEPLVLHLGDEDSGEPVARLEIRGARPDAAARATLDVVAMRAAAEIDRLHQARRLRLREEEVAGARTRVLQAADEERRRIGRDLHDGAQQRLVSLAHLIDLGVRRLDDAPDEQAVMLLRRAREEATAALEELRELSRGLHPVGLAERGLGPALEALAGRAPLPLRVGALPARRLPDPVEVTAWFVICEGLANAAKHAGAGEVRADVEDRGSSVVVTVSDDGAGGADPEAGSGLRGLRDRVAVLGGRLDVTSPRGGGTTLRASLPLAAWRTAHEPYLEFGYDGDGGAGLTSISEVLAGRRRLSCGLAREWDLEGGPPRPGTVLPVRDHHGRHHGAVEVQRVSVVPFGALEQEVPDARAAGFDSLDAWLEQRRSFYDGCRHEIAILLGEPGWRLTDDELMVVLWFRVVER